jgi:hypothetical protein
MYEGVTQKGAQIQMLPSGTNVTSTGTVSMSNGATWTVQWTVKAKVTATASQAIDLTVKVTAQ